MNSRKWKSFDCPRRLKLPRRPKNRQQRNLLPLGPVIVYATLEIPQIMLTEAFLSFLGFGVQAPLASWGSLAADGIQNIAVFERDRIAQFRAVECRAVARTAIGNDKNFRKGLDFDVLARQPAVRNAQIAFRMPTDDKFTAFDQNPLVFAFFVLKFEPKFGHFQ